MQDDHTITDARRYVLTALGEHAADFDIEAIITDVRAAIESWDFTLLDVESSTVKFWAIVLRHANDQLGQVPGCPSWCRLPAGHRFEDVEPDGTLVGYHEGILATVDDDQGDEVSIDLGRKITRTSDGHDTIGPLTIVVNANGAEFSDPHVLRDLGDAIRAAARRIEQG